jgi:probable F420-dependent oxidoreductase
LVADASTELEALGYGAILLPSRGPLPFVTRACEILAATRRTVVGASVVVIGDQTSKQAATTYSTVSSRFPGRFLLGLGVGHEENPVVAPLTAMARYLDDLDELECFVPRGHRTVAALGPKMVRLAESQSSGPLANLISTGRAHEIRSNLDAGTTLAVMVMAVANRTPEAARQTAREEMSRYFARPHYIADLIRQGFDEADLVAPVADRVIDALVAWGGPEAVRERVHQYLDAGVDHVTLNFVPYSSESVPMETWRQYAEVARP